MSESLSIERVALADLVHDPANVRLHPDKNLDAIKASLARFGQQKPIVVDRNNVVVAGNGTLAAAKMLAWDTIAVVRTDLAGAEATAFAIADNRTGELAEWDKDALAAQLSSLDPDLLVGFDAADMESLLDIKEPAELVEDEVSEPPADPITKPGDLWILGDHRLLCGDATKAEDVQRLFGNDRSDAVLTDPPYGVSYVGKTDKALKIQNDGADNLRDLLAESLGLASRFCKPGGVWYVTAPPGPPFLDFAVVLTDLEIWRQTIVWVKDTFVFGRSDYHYRHEAIFYGWNQGAAHREPPDRKQDTVWEFDRPRANREHPTMKPVELYARMLRMSTQPNDLIHEPFGGSGTTLVACEQLGRRCFATEIDPQYCDVIVERWEKLTGKKAERHVAGHE